MTTRKFGIDPMPFAVNLHISGFKIKGRPPHLLGQTTLFQ